MLFSFRCAHRLGRAWCSGRVGAILHRRHHGHSFGHTTGQTDDQTTPDRRARSPRRSSKVLSLLSSRGHIGQRSLIDINVVPRSTKKKNEIDVANTIHPLLRASSSSSHSNNVLSSTGSILARVNLTVNNKNYTTLYTIQNIIPTTLPSKEC